MKVSKIELQRALERVKPGLASKEIITQSTSFAFMGNRIATYNDEISLSHPIEGLNVTGAVKAQSLYELLSKITHEEIEIEWQEGQIMITAGRCKAGLAVEHEIKLPIEKIDESTRWSPVPADFISALQLCYPCCSRDASRPVLTCIHVNGNILEASDSFRIIRYQLDSAVPVGKFLMPASAARELVRYDVKEIAKSHEQGWMHFRTEDGTVFSSRVFNGEFPDVSPYLSFDGVDLVLPDTAVQALGRTQVFAKGDVITDGTAMVTVEVEKNRVKLSSYDESGWVEETLRVQYDGEPIGFTISIEFLSMLLKLTRTCVLSVGKVRFTGEKWTHVVATMAPRKRGKA